MKKIKCEVIKLFFPILDPDVPKIETFYDFGDKLTIEFKHIFYNFFKTQKFEIDNNFIKASYKLFDKIKIYRRLSKAQKSKKAFYSNHYFENFTIIVFDVIARQRYFDAIKIWKAITDIVIKWEDKNKNYYIHKGTPYYFASVASLRAMDIDSTFVFMGLALEEDKFTCDNWENNPAYYFLTLNDTVNEHFLKDIVSYLINFVKDRLDGSGNSNGRYKDSYKHKRNGLLNYQKLRSKFFDNSNVKEETKYYFSYSIIRIWYLRTLHKNKVGDKILAPLIFSQSIGSLLITIELLLRIKYNKKTFRPLFEALAQDEGWDKNKINPVNQERDLNFNKWFNKHLRKNGMFNDFCLIYGLRNFTFHSHISKQILWENNTVIIQRVLNCLFKTIEIL